MPVRMTVLHAEDHERLLRKVAHEAVERFVCCTNKVGATMVPGLFDPAEIAGRRLSDVRVYYSRRSGPSNGGMSRPIAKGSVALLI
jgi:hypothetical protein